MAWASCSGVFGLVIEVMFHNSTHYSCPPVNYYQTEGKPVRDRARIEVDDERASIRSPGPNLGLRTVL